ELAAGDLAGYFASEVLDYLDPTTRELALATSSLDYVLPDVARAVTGEAAAESILADLHRRGCFTERLAGREAVYRFHPLFRDFLRARAEAALGSGRVSEIRSCSAALLESRGAIGEALDLYRQAGDQAGLAGCVTRNADALLLQGRYELLREALTALQNGDPWLEFWRGAVALPFRPAESLPRFESAYRLMAEAGERVGRVRAWSGVLDAILLAMGDWERIDPWLALLPEIQGQLDSLPSELREQVVASAFQALCLYLPTHPDYPFWERCALEVFARTRNPMVHHRIGFSQVYHCMRMGGMAQAGVIIQACRASTDARQAEPFLALRYMEAIYYLLQRNTDECLRAVREGLELAERTGVRAYDAITMIQGAVSCINDGREAEAEELLQRTAASEHFHRPKNRCVYYVARGHLAMLRGLLNEAEAHTAQALAASQELGDPFIDAMAWFVRARVLTRLGRKESDQAWARLGELSQGHGWALLEFWYHVYSAVVAVSRGDEPGALEHLRKGLREARMRDVREFFFCPPDDVEPALSLALRAGVEPDFVRELIARYDLLPRVPPAERQGWPWQVEIVTLGRFEVWVRGQPLKLPRRTPVKLLELLRLVVAADASGVPEPAVAEALWPDSPGDAAHQMFAVSLHRLRTLLGIPGALILRENRLRLDPQRVWVDARAFREHLDRGQFESAVALYAGPFLPDEPCPELARTRDRLRAQFARAVGVLARRAVESGDPQEAMDLVHRGLEADPQSDALQSHLRQASLFPSRGENNGGKRPGG
ncbi:MAG: hypothetical protein AB1758_23225, partial [Candidatus Eremiobacterota bacterium]